VYIENKDVLVPGFRKYWTQKPECHALMNKHPEVASVVQQVYKELSDNENLAGFTPAKVGERSECASVGSNAEENRANFCKAVVGKSLFSALYCKYIVTLNQLKAVLNVSPQEGQSDSVKSAAQDDDFQEVKRH
jgi:hypothetical protein